MRRCDSELCLQLACGIQPRRFRIAIIDPKNPNQELIKGYLSPITLKLTWGIMVVYVLRKCRCTVTKVDFLDAEIAPQNTFWIRMPSLWKSLPHLSVAEVEARILSFPVDDLRSMQKTDQPKQKLTDEPNKGHSLYIPGSASSECVRLHAKAPFQPAGKCSASP